MAIDAVEALAAAEPDFPWATTTSRTRATSTTTATCSSPMALWTTSSCCTPATTRPTAGASRARTRSGRRAMSSARRPAADDPEADGLRVFNYTTQPEDAGHRGDRARVRSRPRPAGPVRLRHRPGQRRRLVGPDEHGARTAVGCSRPCRPTWARGASTCSAGSSPRCSTTAAVAPTVRARPGLPNRREGTESAVRVNLPAKRVEVGRRTPATWPGGPPTTRAGLTSG